MKRPESDPWSAATFEGARAAQTREAASRATAYERIRWACEMSEAIRERKLTGPGKETTEHTDHPDRIKLRNTLLRSASYVGHGTKHTE